MLICQSFIFLSMGTRWCCKLIELKPLKQIQYEYKKLLQKYEPDLGKLTIFDLKRLIGEIKLFWYRNQSYVNYFLNHITDDDEVAVLAGAVRIEIASNEHLKYILVGKLRLINDPLLKMESFYKTDESLVNMEYINSFLKNCIKDMLILCEKFPEDFYVLPVSLARSSERREYYSDLSKIAENILLSIFSIEYKTIQEFYADNNSYESIEEKLFPYIRKQLIFNDLKDSDLSLRDRCSKYIKLNQINIHVLNQLSESQLFSMMVLPFYMQAIDIIISVKSFHLIPFICDDITFQYYNMVFHSKLRGDIPDRIFLNTVISYVAQKILDFSNKDYQFIKKYMGNGKMTHAISESFEDGEIPGISEIAECVRAYTCYNK